MPAFYQIPKEEVLTLLDSGKEGLTSNKLVYKREVYGKNVLDETKKKSALGRFLGEFTEPLVLVLIVAAAMSFILNSPRDGIVIVSIVLVNAFIGFFQEYKAERVIESLHKYFAPHAKVKRDGSIVEILAAEIVPGDVVYLEEGDAIPADIRLFEATNAGTNDFALTGESVPKKKFTHVIGEDVPLAKRDNMVFLGTTLVRGNCTGVVVATGMNTELGRIARMTQNIGDEISPLQKEIGNLALKLTMIAGVLAVALFLIQRTQHAPLYTGIVAALSIAAACVPEGLPAQVSVMLSLGAGRLAQKKAIVKRLSSVDTLGSASVICTDKTGTITKNEMTVVRWWIDNAEYRATTTGYEATGDIVDERGKPVTREIFSAYHLFFECCVLDSTARVHAPDKEHQTWYAIGDPTEAALLVLAQKAGFDVDELNVRYKQLKLFPFDSGRKRMSSVRQVDSKIISFSKGAPQVMLSLSTHYRSKGEVLPITDAMKQRITAQCDRYSSEALRVIALAYTIMPDSHEVTMEQAESDLIFLGLVAIIDPPREGVADAIRNAHEAHIRTMMVTGDYALTAKAVGRLIHMEGDEQSDIPIIEGTELERMTDAELIDKLKITSVIFARTAPEDKFRIVRCLEDAGEVVAVTGDGVNDAPALKRADIGIAMGKTGTDVAKEASEIILADDSFATLVDVIREGRTIFANLRKTIVCSLSSNGGELMTVLYGSFGYLMGFPNPISAIHILLVDLVGEMLPLIALTWDPPNDTMMREKPRNMNDHFLNKHTSIDILYNALLMGLFPFINFIIFSKSSGLIEDNTTLHMRGMTLTYATLIMCDWINIMSHRSNTQSLFSRYLWSNPRILLSLLASLFFVLNISYNPWISRYIDTAPLAIRDWLFVILGGICFLLFQEARKLYRRQKIESSIYCTDDNRKST